MAHSHHRCHLVPYLHSLTRQRSSTQWNPNVTKSRPQKLAESAILAALSSSQRLKDELPRLLPHSATGSHCHSCYASMHCLYLCLVYCYPAWPDALWRGAAGAVSRRQAGC